MATSQPQSRALISGAGIAGLVLAYWLLKAGWHVTVIERAVSLRENGQSVDIKEAAMDVIKSMSLEEKIRSKATGETAIAFVDESGEVLGVFEVPEEEASGGRLSEIEIVRADLVQVLYDAIKDHPDVEFRFDETVTAVQRNSDGTVVASFAKQPPQAYSVIAAADGVGSKLRAMVSGGSGVSAFKSLNRFLCYFTVEEDLLGPGNDMSQWLGLVGGRSVLLRPDPSGSTWAALQFAVDPADQKRLEQCRAATRTDSSVMRDLFLRAFPEDCWVLPQIRKGLEAATDFYSSEVALIVAPKLHRDGVVLVGDAGYCPTPFTGMGSSLAIVGAYLLAGELMSHPGDVDAALKRYEQVALPFARDIQSSAPIMATLLSPHTQWVLNLRKHMIRAFAYLIKSWIATVLGLLVATVSGKLPSVKIPGLSKTAFQLPAYSWN